MNPAAHPAAAAAPAHLVDHAARIEAVRRLLREQGLDALLAWGRGGGAPERHANLVYLSGYYPGFPTIPDLAGPSGWADQGYGAVLVTAAETVLFADSPRLDPATVAASRIEVSSDQVATVADALGALGLASGRVGLAGGDAMTQRQARRLAQLRPALTLVDADALALALRCVKSPAEQRAMRAAARLGRRAIEQALAAAVPGATEADAVADAAGLVLRAGGAPYNAFTDTYGDGGGSTRHRLPIWEAGRRFAAGQLFTIDISGTLDCYWYDLSRSRVVGGRPDARQARAIALAQETVDAVVAALRPGATIGAAARAGFAALAREPGVGGGHFTALGHGLGLGFEPPWVTAEEATVVEPGMCLAIEKRVILDDRWGATFERDVLVTEEGAVDLGDPPAAG